jgi:NAD(P)-dependent dehydrogenase (short-subunit alcohol dehydrogenase family)
VILREQERTMKTVLITGGNDGMGRATALRVAGPDTDLILVGRNRQRGAEAEGAVAAAGGSAIFLPIDLSTGAGVRELAGHVERRTPRLDALVHAAGGLFSRERILTEEGLERSFAIQVLARFTLTELLLDRLRAADHPRVVAIAGGGAYGGKLDLGDLQGERSHSHFGSIRKQAAANDLLTRAQMTRHEGIAFYNYGPGLVRTKVTTWHPLMRALLGSVGRLWSHSPDEAAADIVELFLGAHPAGFYGPGLRYRGTEPRGADPERIDELWTYLAALMPETPSEA